MAGGLLTAWQWHLPPRLLHSLVGVADTAGAVAVMVEASAVAAFTVEDLAEVDFGVVAEALPDVAFTEEALVSRAAAIEGVAMVAATATVAMVVDTADTVTTITDLVL